MPGVPEVKLGSFSLVGSLPGSVAAKSSATIAVQMDTSVVGAKFGAIRLMSNDTNEEVYDFNVSGTVTATPASGTPAITLPRPALAYRMGQEFSSDSRSPRNAASFCGSLVPM